MIGAVVDEVLKEMENAKNEGMKASDDYMDTETGLLFLRMSLEPCGLMKYLTVL